MKKIATEIIEIDELIRARKIDDALFRLGEVDEKKLRPAEGEQVAALYRRLGAHRQALQILRPLVIGSGRKVPHSSPTAKIEYGAALIQMDLVREGRHFLQLESTRDHRDAKKWHALSFLYDSQLEKASVEIKKIIPDFKDDAYEALILKVNLMVALLATLESLEAQKVFREVAEEVALEIDKQNAVRLKVAYDSLMVQSVFFSASNRRLPLIDRVPENELDFSALFAAYFHEGRAKRISRSAVDQKYYFLRAHAWSLNWREGVREIDLHYSRIFQNERLAWVKMGTRSVHYQAKYLRALSTDPVFSFSRESPKVAFTKVFKILNLPAPPKLRQLFQLFYQEQYAFLTPFSIWDALSPEEHFIEPHSPNRVHQWVKRLKNWLKENEIPATVQSGLLGYQMIPSVPLSCSTDQIHSKNSEADLFLEIKKRFTPQEWFSIRDLQAISEFKPRELQYRLKNFVFDNKIEKRGQARAVRYRIKNDSASLA